MYAINIGFLNYLIDLLLIDLVMNNKDKYFSLLIEYPLIKEKDDNKAEKVIYGFDFPTEKKQVD